MANMETLELIPGWEDLYGIYNYDYIIPVRNIWYD